MPATYQTVRLAPGRHARPDEGVCVMELASMLAGEPLTDRPCTVSPLLAALLRGYNDGLDADRRQSLKRYAADCLGTAQGRVPERERRHLLRTWLAAADSPLAALGVRLRVLDVQHLGRSLGSRVRTGADPDLHRRTLALLDELIAVAGPPATPALPGPARRTAPA